jgi:peptidoglycan/xylan/chitin deacetylase (PgdA/CDA1 family)
VRRRELLTALALGTWAAVGGTAAAARSGPSTLTRLPGPGRSVAITVDDGTDAEVLEAYLDFAESTGVRLTFFANGRRPGWSTHAMRIAALVESGQVQIGNHTWFHKNLTRLGERSIASEVTRNERFFRTHYGVSSRPYFRPPYGAHNARTDRICADLGYSRIVMWNENLGDSRLLTPGELLAQARVALRPQGLVLAHANHPTITTLFPQISELLRESALVTRTLDDVFVPSRAT